MSETDADRFRAKAEECRKQAERSASPLDKGILAAAGWRMDQAGGSRRRKAADVVAPSIEGHLTPAPRNSPVKKVDSKGIIELTSYSAARSAGCSAPWSIRSISNSSITAALLVLGVADR